MIQSILEIALPLFLMMDPFGNVPLFIALTKDIPHKRQRKVIIRELIIALAIILLFTFIGNRILALLGVKHETLQIGGGIILFIISLKLIFPPDKETESKMKGEPLIVPLAIPLVAGPSILAAVTIYSKTETPTVLFGAIFIAWLLSAIILICSNGIKRLLKEPGIAAAERLMGLILTLIAIQMFLSGFAVFLKL